MYVHGSKLPLHGALVEIANRTAERIKHLSFADGRRRTFEPVTDGSPMCPACHILWNKPSTLEAIEDEDDMSRYACSQCKGRYQLGR